MLVGIASFPKLYKYSLLPALSAESHGQRSLVSCRLWGSTELDMTEATELNLLCPTETDLLWGHESWT